MKANFQKGMIAFCPFSSDRIVTKLAAILAIAFTAAGCTQEEETPWTRVKAAAPQVTVASNTPDAAVKSWWQARDARSNFGSKICAEMRGVYGPVDGALVSLASANIVEDLTDPGRCAPTVYSRDISKVDIQSDTRALVEAQVRNSTPVSKGYVMDKDEESQKRKGVRMQYLLEREDAQKPWRISQIYSFSRYCSNDSVNGWCVLYDGDKGTANSYVNEFAQ